MLDFIALMIAGVIVVAAGQLLAWFLVGLSTKDDDL